MFAEYNPNPRNKRVGDCVVRALSKVLNKTWQEVYIDLAVEGYKAADMPSANHVWGAYLEKQGYEKKILSDRCPDCYTVADFCNEHKTGYYVLATGSHVVAVIDGFYFDAWDSGEEVPTFYYERKQENESK